MQEERLRKLLAVYGIVVGIMIIAQWAVFILIGEVPELETEPTRIAFHIAAEFATALALFVGSMGLARQKNWGYPAFLLSLGMLSYTIIVSPGYFAQDGEMVFVAMFAILWIITIAAIVVAIRNEPGLRGRH